MDKVSHEKVWAEADRLLTELMNGEPESYWSKSIVHMLFPDAESYY